MHLILKEENKVYKKLLELSFPVTFYFILSLRPNPIAFSIFQCFK